MGLTSQILGKAWRKREGPTDRIRKLCVSCRDTFLREVIPAALELPTIVHNGFLGREYEALRLPGPAYPRPGDYGDGKYISGAAGHYRAAYSQIC